MPVSHYCFTLQNLKYSCLILWLTLILFSLSCVNKQKNEFNNHNRVICFTKDSVTLLIINKTAEEDAILKVDKNGQAFEFAKRKCLTYDGEYLELYPDGKFKTTGSYCEGTPCNAWFLFSDTESGHPRKYKVYNSIGDLIYVQEGDSAGNLIYEMGERPKGLNPNDAQNFINMKKN